MYDAELYRSKEEVRTQMATRDPLQLFEERLRREHGFDAAARAALETSVEQELNTAVEQAEAGELEPVERLGRDVYTEPPPC